MTLLPMKPGTCPECGVRHKPDEPHNQQSLAYQYTFYDKHGRWPTWADAIAHCAEDIKRLWIEELTAYGITEEDFEIEVSVDNSENRTNQGD